MSANSGEGVTERVRHWVTRRIAAGRVSGRASQLALTRT